MIITCEHLYSGNFNHIGNRFITSPHLKQMLSKRSIRFLRELTPSKALIQTWLPEGYVAISEVHNTTDEYERSTVSNHTIIVAVQDYFKLHQERDKAVFGRYFIHGLEEPPKSLEPLRVETK